MNFGTVELDDDTLAFWRDAREFFDEHVTAEVLEQERTDGDGFNEALHLAMGQRGWVATRWPKSEGGADLDPMRARIVALEWARSGAPYVLASTTLLPPIAIRMFGSPEVQTEVLPGVADGTVRICLGYTEPDCGSDLAAVRTRAERDGDGWIINGQKMFTTGAQFSQYCFLLTRTDPTAPVHAGLTVFLLPLDTPGVEIRPIGTLGGERTNFVYLSDVRIDDRWRLGDVNAGWTVVAAPLSQEHGIAADGEDPTIGGPYLTECEKLLAEFLRWAAAQSTDTGTPVLDDAGVAERLGEAIVSVEMTRCAAGPPARVLSSDLLIHIASQLIDIVGPTALLVREADRSAGNGAFEAGFRFAPGTAIYGGSTDIARNVIAERFLGLPRSTPRRSTK
ncbi:acyl-CoA dehydrogenase family protein [Mycolicibacterium moriokaense]|uniref:Alkylation response protein AidB-like acyl-CoA dehydrogenase n=1 Tax=Mycolicibacterium moriokaense TaxID=39691 RepID=A0A318HBH5_9MYCO|nr:acyl-CoA dehydrogenase family protein [Mycolicibacterium moriokaense]PXX01627.1 alkylation response protein AidB-like acyl-CoA dehydrogenase [Mycolicibacterium moriokaense]